MGKTELVIGRKTLANVYCLKTLSYIFALHIT